MITVVDLNTLKCAVLAKTAVLTLYYPVRLLM